MKYEIIKLFVFLKSNLNEFMNLLIFFVFGFWNLIGNYRVIKNVVGN